MSCLDTNRGAIVSDCGLYRYQLWRRWAHGPEMVFVMLNPSRADSVVDDPTLRRCIGFAKREGAGGLKVVNLFAYRSTSPKALARAEDPIGPENDQHLCLALATPSDGEWGMVVAAWGANPIAPSRAPVVHQLRASLFCLGRTACGAPRHPLYVAQDTPFEPFAYEGAL